MKHFFYTLFLLLFGWQMGMYADETIDWLSNLDKSLANRDKFEKIRVDRIDALKRELFEVEKLPNKKSNDRYYELMYSLYNEYKSYCYDSAHHYAYECLAIASFNNQKDRIVEASNAVAFSLISAGFLTEANSENGIILGHMLSLELFNNS